MVNIRSNSGSAHRFSRAIASVMAVILAVSLVFTPALKVSAEGTGSSAELKISENGLDISAKVYLDAENMVFALLGALGIQNQVLANAGIYLSSEALAVQFVPLLSQAYGVNLSKFSENLAASVFAPDSGSPYALPAQTFAMLQGGIQNSITSSISNLDPQAFTALGQTLVPHITALGETLTESMAVGVAPKTIAMPSGDVNVSLMTISFGPEAISAVTSQLLNSLAQDDAVKTAAAEVFDMLKSSGTLSTSGEIADMTGEQAMDAVWAQLPQMATEVESGITQSGISFAVNVAMDRESGSPVSVGIALTVEEETMTLDFRFAGNAYGLEMYIPGESSMSVWFVISEDSDSAYSAAFFMQESGRDVARMSLDWNKTTGAYTLTMTSDDDSVTIAGTILTAENVTVITLNQVNGSDLGNISLTLRSADNITVPAFTEVLTMSEEEITTLVQSVTAVVNSLSGIVDAI